MSAEVQKKRIPNGFKFVFGGGAGMMATVVVQPLDLIKNRMQLNVAKVPMTTVVGEIMKNEGFTGLYTGLSAGLLRQATYGTTRLGVYTLLLEHYEKQMNTKNLPFALKAMIGVMAGGIGAFVGTPAEVALIRMTSDGRLPPEQRRNYTNVFNALMRIIKEEGIAKLWRGTTPTVTRAMVVNAVQLSTYTQAREAFSKWIPEGLGLFFCASMCSGLATTVASMPVDILKTRIQNSTGGQSVVTVLKAILVKEGVFSLWKGFFPYYARLGPHTVLTFIFLEQINATYLKYS